MPAPRAFVRDNHATSQIPLRVVKGNWEAYFARFANFYRWLVGY